MVLFILLGAAALVPSLLLVTYFHRRDVFPEPPAVLWRTFGLGIVVIFPVCLVAWPLDALAQQLGNPLAYGFATAFFGAAIPEELFKFAVVYFYAARQADFDEPMDGIVYGATASLGFATLENVLYVADGGLPIAVLRAFLAVPGHAFLGAIMGYYVARAKFTDGDRKPFLIRAVAIPIVLHGLYDAPLLATELLGEDPTASAAGCLVLAFLPLAPAVVVGETVWALRLVRRLRGEQLAGGGPPPLPAPAAVPSGETGEERTAPAVVPPPVPPPEKRQGSGRVVSWLLTLLGGLFACGGALVSLGILLVVTEEELSSEDLFYNGVAGVVLGLLPLLAGAFCFFWGIRRLNRTG